MTTFDGIMCRNYGDYPQEHLNFMSYIFIYYACVVLILLKSYCYISIAVIAPTNLTSHATSVTKLNGTNFSEWKEQVEFTLGVLELDMALLKDKPASLTETSTPEEKTLFNA